MRVTRVTAVVVFLFYVFLWVLALNGVSSLVPVLAIPLVLAVLVAFGVWLNRFMGITPRTQHFQDSEVSVAMKTYRHGATSASHEAPATDSLDTTPPSNSEPSDEGGPPQ
ncbi:MAG TPA: hypothetical protein VIJ86_02460 [Acidimicrobiales bacterium]